MDVNRYISGPPHNQSQPQFLGRFLDRFWANFEADFGSILGLNLIDIPINRFGYKCTGLITQSLQAVIITLSATIIRTNFGPILDQFWTDFGPIFFANCWTMYWIVF